MRRLLWILVPLLLVAGAEVATRRLDAGSYARSAWYEGVSDRLDRGPIDFLFVGTSRTASGLVPSAWESEVREELGREVVCVNLGRAFSGPVAHWFGLRELVRRHPDAMRGVTVLFEMSAGLPAFTQTWEEPWFYPGNTQLVVDYMDRGDLVRFLRADPDFEERAGVVARYLARPSALFSGRRRLQQSIEWRGTRAVTAALAGLGVSSTGSAAGSELPGQRQLRTDEGGIRLQRELVVERTDPEALAAQQPLRPWDGTVVCQTAEFLAQHGVRVAFHEVPVPSYVWTVNETEVRQADRAAFQTWAGANGIRLIPARVSVDDSDFPDLSHLREARIVEYTRSLARSYLEVRDR